MYCRTSNEIRDIHRRQLEDLEIRVSNGRQTEKLLCTEIDKLKNYNATLQSNCDEVISVCKVHGFDSQKLFLLDQ